MTAAAAELVREVEVAGGQLILLDNGELRVTAPEPLADGLVSRLRQHKPEVIDYLAPPAPAPAELSGWDPESRHLIEWFGRTPAPAQPFRLAPGVFVARPAHFWEALHRDIAAGPDGPRARYGALQQDLRRLAALMKSRESAKP